MRGVILGIEEGRGIIAGDNQQRFSFPLSAWRSAGQPRAGQIVDFQESGAEAVSVFVVPHATPIGADASTSALLGAISVVCLALGFLFPVVPTVAALVLGVIGAQQARAEGNGTALVLSRIGWIGGMIMLLLGAFLIVGLIIFVGGIAGLGLWHLPFGDLFY